MKPLYRLTVNGENITPKINGRLINLTLTDERGEKADQLDISLSDHDGALDIPPRKAAIELWLGKRTEQGDDLVYKGSFTVDDVQHSGTPDVLTLQARSSDFNGPLKAKREHSWHAMPLGDILGTIARRHNLEPVIDAALANQVIDHIDQTNESDLNFLARLGKHHDAVATVKAGRLLFGTAGTGKTASGAAIPAYTITRKDGDRHTYSESGRNSDYTGVQANWNEQKHARLQPVIAGEEGNLKVIRHTYPTEKDARIGAQSEWQKLQREGATFNLELAAGTPDIYPETPVKAQGWKKIINDTPWLITRVVHSVSDSGYTNSVDMEVNGA